MKLDVVSRLLPMLSARFELSIHSWQVHTQASAMYVFLNCSTQMSTHLLSYSDCCGKCSCNRVWRNIRKTQYDANNNLSSCHFRDYVSYLFAMLGFFISLQLCLSARSFQPAIEFLDVDITDMQKVVSIFNHCGCGTFSFHWTVIQYIGGCLVIIYVI